MRLDSFLFENGYYNSRNKASEAIKRGEVFINGKTVLKPSFEINGDEKIEISEKEKPFVSLGGYKLSKAVKDFSPEISGLTFVDAGASTGGFTDCLLRNGAKRVFCVDVGVGLLDESLKNNPKVTVMDGTNVRFLTANNFDCVIDAAVADCSFISLEYILPSLFNIVKEGGYVISLIKPQFELNKKTRLKNGIVRDEKTRAEVIKRLYDFAKDLGFSVAGFTSAPEVQDKNKEYLFWLVKGKAEEIPFRKILENI